MTAKKKYTISDELLNIPATDEAAEATEQEQTDNAPKRTRKPTLRPRERRTKRFNLLLTPSLYDKLDKASLAAGFRSMNDYINAILESYLK